MLSKMLPVQYIFDQSHDDWTECNIHVTPNAIKWSCDKNLSVQKNGQACEVYFDYQCTKFSPGTQLRGLPSRPKNRRGIGKEM